MSCPSGKAWYVCAKGNFRGCCSVDPCTSGVCPDDEHAHLTHWDLSPTTTKQRTSSSSTFSTTTSSVTSSTTAQSSPATPAQPHAASPTTATARPSVTSGTGSWPSDKGALIGGVVGGVAAAIAILAILVCLIHRRRRKEGKRFTVLWGGLRDDRKGGQSTIRAQNETTRPENEPVHHSSTFTSPGKKTISSLDSSPDTSLADSSNNSTTAYAPLPPIPPSSCLIPSTPGRTGVTPELSDTGFYRQRAELASNSRSELINVPPGQRKHKPATVTNSSAKSAALCPRQQVSPSGALQMQQTPPIVTSDGVMLMPNLDQGSRWRTSDRHVMSFMQYESGSGSEKGNGKGPPEGKEGGDVGLGLRGVKVAGYGSREKG